MKKAITCFAVILATAVFFSAIPAAGTAETAFKLGDELLFSKYYGLIKGKKVGLVTNQSGVDSQGRSIIDKLAADQSSRLTALFAPEHGIDGAAAAGKYVASYTHEKLGIPVYSLYGGTRMPTAGMLNGIDVLVFDIQDIGARSYTYMSTLNYCMVAAQKYGKQVIVLDRPNPLGGETVEGPMLEDPFKTFVGVDNLPMAHGMTAGELALFFNRNIGANLRVVPMEGYTRKMIFQDTGLKWVPTSPNIPDLEAVFGYMATGLGEGTGIAQADKFRWIGGKGVDAAEFARLLNNAGLPGIAFIPETRGASGGVRLNITDPRTFNPALTGIYALTYAHSLNNFKVPKSGSTVVMFDKIMGTDKIGQYLEQGLSPALIREQYLPGLNRFKSERQKYLIYGDLPYGPIYIKVGGSTVEFDSPPYIDNNNRVIVPLRAVCEALGAQVGWNPITQVITITRGTDTIIFTIGNKTALVNGKQQVMDTVPVIRNSRTMVPVRYVGEYLGAAVGWDSIKLIVSVTQP